MLQNILGKMIKIIVIPITILQIEADIKIQSKTTMREGKEAEI